MSYYPVAWVKMRVNKNQVWAGFCGKTNHLFTLAVNFLHPLTVQDLIATDERCEESGRCLFFSCSLNRSSAATRLSDAGIKKRRKNDKPVNAKFGEIIFSEMNLGEMRSGVFTGPDESPWFEITTDAK